MNEHFRQVRMHELRYVLKSKMVGWLGEWGSSKHNARDYQSMSTRPHPSPQCLLFLCCFNCVTLQWYNSTIESWTLYTRVLEYVGKASSELHTPLFVRTFSPVSAPETVYSMCLLFVCSFNCVSYCNGILRLKSKLFKLNETLHVNKSPKCI